MAPLLVTGNLPRIEQLWAEAPAPPERSLRANAALLAAYDLAGDEADWIEFAAEMNALDEAGQATFVENLSRAAADGRIADGVALLNLDSWLWVWVQDLFEPASLSVPGPNGPQVMRAMVTSGYHAVDLDGDGMLTDTEAPLDTLFRDLLGPNIAVVSSGVYRPGADLTATLDRAYFLSATGNVESVPPYETGTASYPHGRVVIGNAGDSRPFPEMLTLFEAQGVQEPLYVDTSWLAAGHVDEFMTVVPASNERGWALAVADPRSAMALLEAAPAASTVYTDAVQPEISDGDNPLASQAALVLGDQRPVSVGELLADSAFRDANEAAAVAIDANVTALRAEIGLTDAEIVRMPVLYTREDLDERLVGYPRSGINGVVSGSIYLAPDPHGPIVAGVDIFKEAAEEAFSAVGVDVRWLDTSPLTVGGELHCATNVYRDLTVNSTWWEREGST